MMLPVSNQACPYILPFWKKKPHTASPVRVGGHLVFALRTSLRRSLLPVFLLLLGSTEARNRSRKENIIKKLFRSSEERYTALKKTLLIISSVRT